MTDQKTDPKKETPKKGKLEPKIRKIMKSLRCKLSDLEKMSAAEAMADAECEADRLENSLKSLQKEMKAKIQEDPHKRYDICSTFVYSASLLALIPHPSVS